jgi:ATP-dependent DNA helicase RecG
MRDKIKQMLGDGEGLTVEFKRYANKLPKSVYETVCAFSNRYGGYILLGVEDDGAVSGVVPETVTQIKKDFANSLNNPQRFTPTLFIALEEAEIDGKIVLWCYVPLSSQLVMFGGKIYDRAEDGDYDATRNTDTVGMIYDRKKGVSTVSKVFPYAVEEHFEFERLMPIVRRRAKNRYDKHPWGDMSDDEIIQSAGLYEIDMVTGEQGYNLAAVLLFGREHVIRSCTAGAYMTDCLLRRDNLDRYDDRLRVCCNLIDAYSQIMGFIEKHTLDRFFTEDDQSVSVRDKIARELVSNILVHREYSSAFPAKVVIERDRIVAENWCMPKRPGKLDPNTFTPQPKNPLLANFFVNIGFADALGSGVRNLYKYTKIYSGGEPELIEGDVFRTIVPFSLPDAFASDNVSDKTQVSDKMSDNVSDKTQMSDNVSDKTQASDKTSDKTQASDKMSDSVSDKNPRGTLLSYLRENGEVTAAEAAKILGRSVQTARRVLTGLVAEGAVSASGANRNRRYKASVDFNRK